VLDQFSEFGGGYPVFEDSNPDDDKIDDVAEYSVAFTNAEQAGIVTATVTDVDPTLAESATDIWNRAKSGFRKAQSDHTAGIKTETSPRFSVTKLVPAIAGFRSTGSARPSVTSVLHDGDPSIFEQPKPRPLTDVIHETTEDVSGLVKSEMALFKLEIKQRLKLIGPALALFGAAGFVVLYAIGVLIFAAILGLGYAVPLWLSALIVGVTLFLVAAGLVFAGISLLKKMGHLSFLSGGTIQEDIHTITNAFKTRNWAAKQQDLRGGRL
jgi:hypothetical protein